MVQGGRQQPQIKPQKSGEPGPNFAKGCAILVVVYLLLGQPGKLDAIGPRANPTLTFIRVYQFSHPWEAVQMVRSLRRSRKNYRNVLEYELTNVFDKDTAPRGKMEGTWSEILENKAQAPLNSCLKEAPDLDWHSDAHWAIVIDRYAMAGLDTKRGYPSPAPPFCVARAACLLQFFLACQYLFHKRMLMTNRARRRLYLQILGFVTKP